jgi:hypothetical protein
MCPRRANACAIGTMRAETVPLGRTPKGAIKAIRILDFGFWILDIYAASQSKIQNPKSKITLPIPLP